MVELIMLHIQVSILVHVECLLIAIEPALVNKPRFDMQSLCVVVAPIQLVNGEYNDIV